MSYLDQEDPDLIEDLLTRKEFYWFKRWGYDKVAPNIKDIIPRFMLDAEIAKSGYLRLLGHQQFIENYFNPNTDYRRLHVKWSTGSGKTLGGLAIAMNFIRNYHIERELGNQEIGSVFIIGFSERAFKNELLKYPEFGFLSKDERIRLDKLKRLAASGSAIDRDKYRELTTRVKKRFSSRKGNGFFRFYGYKAFVNRIFVPQPGVNINELSEEDIRMALANGKITYNETLLAEFKNSLIICDEIHNVYNSAEKNNWGVALQAVLDREVSVRFVSLSATPLNNSPAEIVDLLNLLLPAAKRVDRQDFFVNDRDLKPGALDKIAELSRGRFSFLIDVNPKYYPRVLNFGQTLREIPYLKFIRCPMSPFHYKTYKQVYTGALSQDSQYLVDFALPNPEDPNGIGIFQTSQIKRLLPNAPAKFKDKYGIDYKDNKIIGDILTRKNLEAYSSKYVAVLDELTSDIAKGNGKVFMYHNVVHMSGVLFIEQMLIRNGYLDEFSSSSDNTICMRCGLTRKEHSKDEIQGGLDIEEVYEDSSDDSFEDIDDSLDNPKKSTKNKKVLSINDKIIATALEVEEPTGEKYYYIPTQSKELLKGEHFIEFDKFLNNLPGNPIKIQVNNDLGKKFGDWLLSKNFVFETDSAKYTILVREPIINGGAQHAKTKKSGHRGQNKHRFMPVRFIMAHSDIDKAQMEHSLERFNSIDNIDGSQFLILVGSKIIKESYDIKALQNEYIISKPDNIPTFIQIRGRAVRKGSHIGLPYENQVVRIKIFTTCLPVKQETGLDKGEYKLSYEEEKYKEKVAAFQVIQKIEKVIHENAIDAIINHDKVQRHMTDDPLGPLPYEPVGVKNFSKELTLDQLNLSTFNVHHAKREVEVIKTIVKRLFIELASIWEYSDLLKAVRSPPINYESELNTSLFSEDNFIIAMGQLIWDNSPAYVEPFIQKTSNKSYTGGGELAPYMGGFASKETVYDLEDPMVVAISDLQDSDDIWSTTGGSYIGAANSTKKSTNSKKLTKANQSNTNISNVNISNVNQISNTNISNVNNTIYNAPIIIDHLFDPADKVITMPGGQDSVIVPIPDGKKQFYILFPVNPSTNNPDIDIELPFRIVKQEESKTININSFIQSKRIDFDYDDKKKIFYRKYVDIAIENMQNVVCEYGTTFHIKFIEECIEYVFRAWTDPTLEKHEFHEFYFKMLYYYDLLSLVMWAYTSKPRVFKEYTKYAIPVRTKDIKLKALAKYEDREEIDINPEETSDLATSGVINLLKSTFNRTSNAWIPEEFRQQYNTTVDKSLTLFAGKKKRNKFITKTNADLLPIGHYISKFPRLYIPDKGWDENPTYLQNEQEFKENNLIVGFDERSNTGVHIRFKIRNPIHNIKKYKDSRQTEKGTVCKSKSKEYLKMVAKKLGAVMPDKVNVDDLCVVIRSKLIRLELKERIKKSNIKYFYFFYEQRPETRHSLS